MDSCHEFPPVLTTEQACKLLQTTKPTLYRMINAKKIPALKYGRIIRLNRDELLKHIAQGNVR
jgi:excisionase family DNA binding protein